MVTLGIKLGPEQYPPADLLSYAVAAEGAGFEAADVSDHFHPWSEEGQACFSWTWLGAAAVSTRDLLLGTGVTCPLLRYHPAIIAQAAATLSCFAPGRTYLGLGTGEALNEYAATGAWPDYGDRQQMLLEAIELIRELWDGGYVTYDGAFYATRKAKLYTPPQGDIPLIVSSLVPDSAGFAGANGDGLFTVAAEPQKLRQIVENFEAGAAEAGRDPSRLPRFIELNVAYTHDTKAALQEFRKYWAGALIPAMFNERLYTPAQSAENGSVVGDDTLLKKLCVSDDPREQAQFAQQFVDLGFTHLYFHSAGPDQARFIHDYGMDVLPLIRKRNARKVAAV